MSSASAAVLASWQAPPLVTAALVASALVYARGWARLSRLRARRFPAWRLAAFLGGLASVWIAAASPLDAFSGLLLTAHMVQHLLLMVVAPPLLLLGAPCLPLLRGLPRGFVREGLSPFLASPAAKRLGRALTHPWVGLSAMAAAMWGWHVPGAYELALHSSAWHEIEHATFLFASTLFWWLVVLPWPSRPRWPGWAIPVYLLAGDIQNTILAAILVFADRVIYPTYAAVPRLFGLTALEDQTLAGALMWVPGSLAFLVPAAAIAWRLLAPQGSAVNLGSPRREPSKPRVTAGLRPALPTAGGLPSVAGSGLTPSPGFDLLRAPVVGPLLRARYGRRALQGTLFLIAALVVVDGLAGPPAGEANLATAVSWTWGRALAVLALLAAGNFFCMACPFTLPRALARRLRLPISGRAFPAALRSKWLAAGLLAVFFWAYEAFDLWNRPAATAGVVIGYFAAAFLVDALFRGASFCKYVCPIGQFQLAGSLVSPLEVKVRQTDVCVRCATHDCLRGNAAQRGCELELFLPAKSGSLDCTFCLDCVKACPHDNVGLLPVVPAGELWRDPPRSSVGRLARRPDLAALSILLLGGALAGAAAMVAPFEGNVASSPAGAALLFAVALAASAALAAAASAFGRVWAGASATFAEVFRRQAMTLVPLALAMWAAHFAFHLATAGPSLVPVLARAAADAGLPAVLAAGAGASSLLSPAAVSAIELLLLDFGLLLTLYAGWRLATELSGERALRLFLPLALAATAFWAAGAWILLQPMAMRGMVH
jgi:cytochrome c oxidase assembly factor CtaG/ferredoxin